MKAASLPLQITARMLSPVMLILSLAVLYRGHHLPGGGFIGGLLAASGIGLILLGSGMAAARRALYVQPVSLTVAGLAIAMVSALAGLFVKPFVLMNGLWLPSFSLPLLGTIHLGTPLLFDLGVYFAVAGYTLTCLFALVETDNKSGLPRSGLFK